jgi:hypothetical protein
MSGNGAYCASYGLPCTCTSAQATMAAYDALPRFLRDTLKNLHGDFDTQDVLAAHERGCSLALIAGQLIRCDREDARTLQIAAYGEPLPH